MEATSIITGYTVRIKPNLNPQLIQAWMSIMVEGNKAQAVIKELRLDPAIQTLHTTNGKWDLLVEIQSDNLVNFDLILSQCEVLCIQFQFREHLSNTHNRVL